MVSKSYSDGFFSIDGNHGFLPIRDPLAVLPERYSSLQRIMDKLPIHLDNGDGGILSREGEIEMVVRNLLEDYSDLVKTEEDMFVLQALYRAYTFLASAYLLEPTHYSFVKTGDYGPARRSLHCKVAVPLCIVSDKIRAAPYLDYAYAYSLGNYVRKSHDLHWSRLEMACKFSGTRDESGFILNHVTINERSPDMIGCIVSILNEEKMSAMKELYEVVVDMNTRRRTMWEASNPKNYNNFRSFIMGIKGNTDIFGEGVVYEDVDPEGAPPRQYRKIRSFLHWTFSQESLNSTLKTNLLAI